MSGGSPKLFISYRREETAGHAGRLYDAIAARFGDENVFMDVELAPGLDFVEQIQTAVDDCRALLVVIGPRWVSTASAGGDGTPRLAEPGDFVRLEVETALRRADVRVIPVLVAGAIMPRPEQLPESLRTLARRNAIELSDGRWRFDVGRLVDALDDTVPLDDAPTELFAAVGRALPQGRASTSAPPAAAPLRVPSGALLAIEGMLVAACAAYLIHLLVMSGGHPFGIAQERAATVVNRALGWGLLGAVVAAWFQLRVRRDGSFAAAVALGALAGAAAGALDAAIWFWALDADQDREELARLPVGLLLGGLFGALARPQRIIAGALAGALLVFLAQLLLSALWADGNPGRYHVFMAVQAGAIALGALTVVLLLSGRRLSDFAR